MVFFKMIYSSLDPARKHGLTAKVVGERHDVLMFNIDYNDATLTLYKWDTICVKLDHY